MYLSFKPGLLPPSRAAPTDCTVWPSLSGSGLHPTTPARTVSEGYSLCTSPHICELLQVVGISQDWLGPEVLMSTPLSPMKPSPR